ncbi:MAG: hypothetical protein IKE43_03480 [Coriobacteriales bacterium]|nr:hypothetical protein [Coriobacteriales bacterium]
MQISCDNRLRSYMESKGYSHIVIDIVTPVGCCTDMTELTTRFAKPEEAAELKTGRFCRVEPFEGGELLILARGLHYDEPIKLGLKSFLGLKDIAVDGIKAWKL